VRTGRLKVNKGTRVPNVEVPYAALQVYETMGKGREARVYGMRWGRINEPKLESTGDMLCIELCLTVHAIRPCYSGAFVHTIQSPETSIKSGGARTNSLWLETMQCFFVNTSAVQTCSIPDATSRFERAGGREQKLQCARRHA